MHSTIDISPTKVDTLSALQALSREERIFLGEGEVVEIRFVASDPLYLEHETVITVPRALLNALFDMDKFNPVDDRNYKVQLDNWLDFDVQHIDELISRVKEIADPDNEVIPFRSTGCFEDDLCMAEVASYLGLPSFAEGLFNQLWKHTNVSEPSYEDIETLCHNESRLTVSRMLCNTHARSRMFRNTHARQLAERFSEVGSDVPKYETTCDWIVMDKFDKYYSKFKAATSLALAKDKARIEANDIATANTNTASIGEVVRQKMRRAGSKYTAQEARYIWKTFSKQVPTVTRQKF
jgi:hypothetical protein